MHSILAAGRYNVKLQFPRLVSLRASPLNFGPSSASFISRTLTLGEIPAFCLVNNVSAMLTGLRPFHYIHKGLTYAIPLPHKQLRKSPSRKLIYLFPLTRFQLERTHCHTYDLEGMKLFKWSVD